ncbi:hypothetical protein [Streptomyces sp. NPDC093984]|uniref:hypothetical protein n=1 Tax=Streptomyces sp. NPDC093984 TaxID=3366052 RepID=UPI003812BB54
MSSASAGVVTSLPVGCLTTVVGESHTARQDVGEDRHGVTEGLVDAELRPRHRRSSDRRGPRVPGRRHRRTHTIPLRRTRPSRRLPRAVRLHLPRR